MGSDLVEKVGGPDGFRAGFMKGTRESSGGGSMQCRPCHIVGRIF